MSTGPIVAIRRWGEMVRFSHSVFALPYALLATFLAARSAWLAGDASHAYPGIAPFVLILVCMASARSVAMTFNRIVDARIDARNPRTAGRAIPTQAITPRQAMLFLGGASAVFVISCGGFYVLSRNAVPLVLSIPLLVYLCLYSYTKRFTQWSHFVLGSAIAFSPAAAWLAIHPASIGWAALILMGAVTLWIGGFDIIYACQDIAVDRDQGLFSLPSRMGPAAALWIARLAHFVTVLLLASLMPVAGLGWIYGIGVAIVAVLLAVENALVRPDDFSRVNVAFFTVNGIVSLIVGALGIVDVLVRS